MRLLMRTCCYLTTDMLIHDLDLSKILDYLKDDQTFSVTPKILRKKEQIVKKSK